MPPKIIIGERRFEWKGIDPLITSLYDAFGWVFYKRVSQIIFLALSFIGLALFVSQFLSGRYTILQQDGSYLKGMIVLYLLDYVMIFIHEGSHAMTCKHYGCKVLGSGFLLYYGMPCFYINTMDIWMADKKGRIATSWAGPYSGFILAGLFSVIVSISPESPASPILFKSAFLWYVALIFNLVPFLELDGYYMLMDWLGIPMLRAKSFDFIKRGLWKKLKGKERFSNQDWLFLLFGTASLLFSILIVLLTIAFWNRRMKGMYVELWGGGWIPKIIFIALIGALLFPVVHGLGMALYKKGREGKRLLSDWWSRIRPSLKEDVSLLMSIHFLKSLDYEKATKVAQGFKRKTYKPGSLVIREGDSGEDFYIIRSGKAEVFRTENGKELHLTTLSMGDYFGELALIEKAPRAASVRAVTRLELLSVKKGDFDRCLAPCIPLTAVVERIKDVEELKKFPLFAKLAPKELDSLHAHLQRQWLPAMTEIIREGDMGQEFYIINSGKAEVLKGGERVKVLEKSDYFGELALVRHCPRQATVKSLTPVELYSLKREHFDELLRRAFG